MSSTKIASRRKSPSAGTNRESSGNRDSFQAVSSDDPLFKRKVLRIFLETVISAEFGALLQNDLRFGELIDSVQAQMESDAELNVLVDNALVPLVQSAGKK